MENQLPDLNKTINPQSMMGSVDLSYFKNEDHLGDKAKLPNVQPQTFLKLVNPNLKVMTSSSQLQEFFKTKNMQSITF